MTEQVNTDPWAGRHPSVAHFKPLFEFGHLPVHLASVSAAFSELADELLTLVGDGPELSAGLRKLLEAKDAVVRQAVLDPGIHRAAEVREWAGGRVVSDRAFSDRSVTDRNTS